MVVVPLPLPLMGQDDEQTTYYQEKVAMKKERKKRIHVDCIIKRVYLVIIEVCVGV